MKLNEPCSQGLAIKGRRCPQYEHACQTFEGHAVWDVLRRPGGWTGGGMAPRRVNRDTVRASLAEVEPWIVEALIDMVEPAALEAADKSENKRKPAQETPND